MVTDKEATAPPKDVDTDDKHFRCNKINTARFHLIDLAALWDKEGWAMEAAMLRAIDKQLYKRAGRQE